MQNKSTKTQQVYKCCVPGCDIKSIENGISFHRFPTAAIIRERWVESCNITSKIGNKSFVCSSHFKDEDYWHGK